VKRDANPRFNNVLLAGIGGIATTPMVGSPFAMARVKRERKANENVVATKGLFRWNDFLALSRIEPCLYYLIFLYNRISFFFFRNIFLFISTVDKKRIW